MSGSILTITNRVSSGRLRAMITAGVVGSILGNANDLKRVVNDCLVSLVLPSVCLILARVYCLTNPGAAHTVFLDLFCLFINWFRWFVSQRLR